MRRCDKIKVISIKRSKEAYNYLFTDTGPNRRHSRAQHKSKVLTILVHDIIDQCHFAFSHSLARFESDQTFVSVGTLNVVFTNWGGNLSSETANSGDVIEITLTDYKSGRFLRGLALANFFCEISIFLILNVY